MKHKDADEASWKNFLAETDYRFCWWCGRGQWDQPQAWWGPWLIERCHLVNKPRVEDRRVAILLCSLCHRLEHGHQLVLPGIELTDIMPSLAEKLYIKKFLDQQYYDRPFVKRFTVGTLPRAKCPKEWMPRLVERQPAAFVLFKC